METKDLTLSPDGLYRTKYANEQSKDPAGSMTGVPADVYIAAMKKELEQMTRSRDFHQHDAVNLREELRRVEKQLQEEYCRRVI